MAKRSKSHSSIPFAVFAILLLAIVGFHLQKQNKNDVLGMTSGSAIFSKEWFAEILAFFGFGDKKTERTPVEYSLPTYGGSQQGNGFSTTGNTESDALLGELESTSDDGGQSELDSLQKEAAGL